MSGVRLQDDQFSQQDISDLISGGSPYTAGHDQVTLTTSWQAVLSTPPDDNYVLVIVKETVAGTVRWSYDNTGAPTDDDSPIIPGLDMSLVVPGWSSIYIGSDNAGDTVNYTYRTVA